jgi:hypothetical protein
MSTEQDLTVSSSEIPTAVNIERKLKNDILDRQLKVDIDETESKLLRRHLSLLKREQNEVHLVRPEIVDLATRVRSSMEVIVVSTFLDYANRVGVLPHDESVLPSELGEPSEEAVENFFRNSYAEASGTPYGLWKNRWLCTMSNALKSVVDVKAYDKDRLKINNGQLTYKFHLDLGRKHRFPKEDALTLTAIEKSFPSRASIELPEVGSPRGLITHSTQSVRINDIFSSGFIAPYKHIRPVSLSEGVVSLPYSDRVFIFDPEILKEAGFRLMRYYENPDDAGEIAEVLEPLPVPVFLASGFYETTFFDPWEAKKRAHIWSFDEPTASFGETQLEVLQQKIKAIN